MVVCLERGADLHVPSWCHCHSLSLASVKSRLVLPSWYRLTRVVPDIGPLHGCVCVYMMHVMWPIDTIYYRVQCVRYNKPLQTLPIIPTPTLAAWIMLTSLPPSPVNTTTNMPHVIFKRKPFCSSLFTTFQDAVTLGKWTWEQKGCSWLPTVSVSWSDPAKSFMHMCLHTAICVQYMALYVHFIIFK